VSKGSWVHDEVVRHFGSFRIEPSCAQCHDVHAEEARVSQPKVLRRSVPAEVLAKMCPDGRAIYCAYLGWLAEPDE
jgi:hypothetical protein